MHAAGTWLLENGKNVSKWWRPENIHKEFLLQFARPNEFYVGLVDGKPAVAAILQTTQTAQDWQAVDNGASPPALYIHWLSIDREFAGKGLAKSMIDFATDVTREKGISTLRVDTNANEQKLRNIYENLGFTLVTILQEDFQETALYEKKIIDT